MDRPRPTSTLVRALAGDNRRNLEAIHHGLYEVPLLRICDSLNFDELLILSYLVWSLRKEDKDHYVKLLSDDLRAEKDDFQMELFEKKKTSRLAAILAYETDYLEGQKVIYSSTTEALKRPRVASLRSKLNPFNQISSSLASRLDSVAASKAAMIKRALSEPPYEYYPEAQFYFIENLRRDNYNMVCCTFLPNKIAGKEQEVREAYALEIARMIRRS